MPLYLTMTIANMILFWELIFLSKTGIKLDYASSNMTWYDSIVPMRPSHGLKSDDFDAMEDQYWIQ